MEREILFRGKKADGEWLHGSLVQFADKCSIVSKEVIEKTPLDFVGVAIVKGIVLNETVGEFRNCKDKNGRDIYEGDILRSSSERLFLVAYDTEHNMMRTFSRGFPFPVALDKGCAERYEVVGNIYDNPELLEQAVIK